MNRVVCLARIYPDSLLVSLDTKGTQIWELCHQHDVRNRRDLTFCNCKIATIKKEVESCNLHLNIVLLIAKIIRLPRGAQVVLP
jgi:hypothetical protein